MQTMHTLFQLISEHPTITMCRCQKQAGTTDCGVFSIAYAVALVHGKNPGKLKFHQDKMRSHLVDCFQKQITYGPLSMPVIDVCIDLA